MAMLAERIAEQASGNFLYAFYVIEALRGAHVLGAMGDAAARVVPLPAGGLTAVYRDFLRRELGVMTVPGQDGLGRFSPRSPSHRIKASPVFMGPRGFHRSGVKDLARKAWPAYCIRSVASVQWPAAHGPTPDTRFTVMWVIYPGGGLSVGGNRTPGPR